MKWLWFICGSFVGATTLSLALAAVDTTGAANQGASGLSEIQVRKQAPINFDDDLRSLSIREENFHERLPGGSQAKLRKKAPKAVSLSAPMSRSVVVSKTMVSSDADRDGITSPSAMIVNSAASSVVGSQTLVADPVRTQEQDHVSEGAEVPRGSNEVPLDKNNSYVPVGKAFKRM